MKTLSAIDANSILHPATNADDFARTGSRIIESGKGIYLRDNSGKQLIDAVAGLWCVNVGYGREEIADAMQKAALELGYYHTFSGMSNSTSSLRKSSICFSIGSGSPLTTKAPA